MYDRDKRQKRGWYKRKSGSDSDWDWDKLQMQAGIKRESELN